MANNINIPNKQSGEQFTADEFNLLLNGVNSAITEFNTNLVSVEKIEWIEGDTKPEIVADVILGTISEGETKYVQMVKVGEQNVAILHSPNYEKLGYEETFTSFDIFNITEAFGSLTYTTIDNIAYICLTSYGVSLAKYENNEFIIIDVLTDLESSYYPTRFSIFQTQLLAVAYDSGNGNPRIIVIDRDTNTRNSALEQKLSDYIGLDYMIIGDDIASDSNYIYLSLYKYDDESNTTGKLEIHKFDSNYDFVEIFYQAIESDNLTIVSAFCKDSNLYLCKYVPGVGQVIRINTTTKVLDANYGGINIGNFRPYVLNLFTDNSLLLAIAEIPSILSPDGQTLIPNVGLDLVNVGEYPIFILIGGLEPIENLYTPIVIGIESPEPLLASALTNSNGVITKFTPSVLDKGPLIMSIPLQDFNLGIVADISDLLTYGTMMAYKLTHDYDYKFPIEIEVDYYAKASELEEISASIGDLKFVKLYESEYQALDLADEIDENTMYIRLPDPISDIRKRII